MANYALINNSTNNVENVVVWDGVAYNSTTQTGWQIPTGYTAIDITEVNPPPFPGCTYINGTWSYPTVNVTPVPDVQGFTVAIISSANITNVEKGYLLGALAALKDEIELGDNTLTEAGWTAMKNSGDLSSDAITAILALAPTYNIPIS